MAEQHELGSDNMFDLLLTVLVLALAAGFIIDYYHHTAFWPFPAIRQYLENSPIEFIAKLAGCAFCQTPHVVFWLSIVWFASPCVLPAILSNAVQFVITIMAGARISWIVDKLMPEKWQYERID